MRIVSVGDASYIAIGRLVENIPSPEFKVGKLLIAVFEPKTKTITLTPYDSDEVDSVTLRGY